MKITLQHIQEILSEYRISARIVDTHHYIEQYRDHPTFRAKFILRVDFLDHKSVVMKLVQQEEHPRLIIEQQSIFSELMRRNGILTPKRYIAGEHYCISYVINDLSLDVTVEEYLGEEIKTIDIEIAGKAGQLMGRMHAISEKEGAHIRVDSIFNVVGYNEVSGYERFRELGEAGQLNLMKYRRNH
ncbi:hypothetical protein BK126_10035 [Paenibacillus sp. FSL H7-0326]|uniref:hypothetical protein n=1 Tax=Paenibacillus sp. FSL H7-0326 TaxID=1921144 RepID=UPI00096C60E2|nr:hypothetical protein [Paenibacillus sp. FSL H7-0326]OMC72305.1 hypothetical protein BK126_10035 [Paenibacillus sp. FSL H7-0326]